MGLLKNKDLMEAARLPDVDGSDSEAELGSSGRDDTF
jgi:hypothetical protein